MSSSSRLIDPRAPNNESDTFSYSKLFSGDFTGFNPSRVNLLELLIRLSYQPSDEDEERFSGYLFSIDERDGWFIDYPDDHPAHTLVDKLAKRFVELKERIFFEGTNEDLLNLIKSLCSAFKEEFEIPLYKARKAKSTEENIEGFVRLITKEEFLFEPTIIKVLSIYCNHLLSDFEIQFGDKKDFPFFNTYHDLIEEMCESDPGIFDGYDDQFQVSVKDYVSFVVKNGSVIRSDSDYVPLQYTAEEREEIEEEEAILEEKDCLLAALGTGYFSTLEFSSNPDGSKYLDDQDQTRATCRDFVEKYPQFREEFIQAIENQILYYPSFHELEKNLEDVKKERKEDMESLVLARLAALAPDLHKTGYYSEGKISENAERDLAVRIDHMKYVIEDCELDLDAHPDATYADSYIKTREAALMANLVRYDFVLDEQHKLECEERMRSNSFLQLPGKLISRYPPHFAMSDFELYGISGVVNNVDQNGSLIMTRIPIPGFDYPGWHYKHGGSELLFSDPSLKTKTEGLPLVHQ